MLLVTGWFLSVQAQTSSFSYQGRLTDGGPPASGSYDLRFTLHDAVEGGAVVGTTVEALGVTVTDGLFTANLDFGSNAFDGSPRWLGMAVRPGGSGAAYTPLLPRQPLMAAPYALFALKGNEGPQGPTGPEGPQGVQGEVGPQGPRGDTGETGPVGPIGPQGEPGLEGAQGPVGLTGPQGAIGPMGSEGAQGAQGIQGATGPQGEPGVDGISIEWLGSLDQSPSSPSLNQAYYDTVDKRAYIFDADGVWQVLVRDGAQGAQGEAGPIGPQGPIGPAGPSGPQGEVGPQGPIGLTGPVGPRGAQGEPGPEGPPGSADAWSRTGNAGIDPTVNFLGTTDNVPLEIKVNGLRALRFEDWIDSSDPDLDPDGAPTLIGGSPANYVGAGVVGSTISGGGAMNYQGWPSPNKILSHSHYAVVGGGINNTIEEDSVSATIAGGSRNYIDTNTSYSVIGGGTQNYIQDTSSSSTIAGGRRNRIGSGAYHGTIGGGIENRIWDGVRDGTIAGGSENTIGLDSDYSTVGGGYYNEIAEGVLRASIAGGSGNTISTNSGYSTIGGGYYNFIGQDSYRVTIAGGSNNDTGVNSDYSTVGGGYNNDISEDAQYATIPGGHDNVAGGNYAFAAGRRAKAVHQGAFVWADSTAADFWSSADDQFLIRASGGVGIGTAYPVTKLTLAGAGAWNSTAGAGIVLHNTTANRRWLWHVLDSGSVQWADHTAGATRMLITTSGNVGIGTVAPAQRLHVSGNILATGTVTGSSDRNRKENFAPVDPEQVLEKVAAMRIQKWNYIGEDTPHVGPVAQDFHEAFQVGIDDKHISMVDADGVALAAIQGLNRKLDGREAALRAENAELRRELAELRQMMRELSER